MSQPRDLAIQEEASSLQSFQFENIRAPSEVENQKASDLEKTINAGIQGAEAGGEDEDENWMYEDTIQEDFED